MSSINKRFFILGILLIISVSTVFAGSFGKYAPSLTTEKARYLAGEAVVINGQGFGKFESVSLSVESYNASLKQNVPLMQWNAYANAKGVFSASIPFDSLRSESGRYTIRAVGDKTGTALDTEIAALLPNPSGDLDQCANGPFSGPFVPCTGSAWQNGNVGQSQGHYYEGDSIPYRLVFDNLVVGDVYTVTIEWDTTQGGKHAIDYLTTYNRTESVGNNPCSGVTNPDCTANATDTFPIPDDPNIPGSINQIPGVFTMWGGDITAVGSYVLSGSYAGNSSTSITITFTAESTSAVLAWSGHIADRNDWVGLGGSASDISGSPYHMRFLDLNGQGGNQDRSLSNVAVRLISRVIIIKQASPETAQVFGFTATGLNPTNFTLVDDGVDNDATPNSATFTVPLGTNQSQAGSVTENANGFYDLTNLTCSVQAGGTSTASPNIPLATVNFTLNYGDTLTCTFFNSITTAANVSVSGRVTDAFGTPLSRANVTIQNLATGETRSISTGSFGYYLFDELASGDSYMVTVAHKRYVFSNNSQIFSLSDAIENLDFVADVQETPQRKTKKAADMSAAFLLSVEQN